MDCLVQAHPSMRAYYEYFNPKCAAKQHELEFKKYFGSAFKVPAVSAILVLIDTTFVQEGFNATVEKHCSLKMRVLRERFNMVVLYRQRKYTFPTSRPELILPLFENFVLVHFDPSDDEDGIEVELITHLARIQSFVRHIQIEAQNDKCIVAHIVCTFVKFYYCRSFGTKIIRYEQLMAYNQQDLTRMFQKQLTTLPDLDCGLLAELVIAKRDPDALQVHETYDDKVEKSLLRFIKNDIDAELGKMLEEG